jgi:hypothetical protein
LSECYREKLSKFMVPPECQVSAHDKAAVTACPLPDNQISTRAQGFRCVIKLHADQGQATNEAGIASILADVHTGTQRDAILFSASANSLHGLRRTNADKRKAALLLLEDAEWSAWSDNAIAKQCGVSHPFVAAVRFSLETVSSEKPAERIGKDKHGKETTIKTGNIGKAGGTVAKRAFVVPSFTRSLGTVHSDLNKPLAQKTGFTGPLAPSTRAKTRPPVERATRWSKVAGCRVTWGRGQSASHALSARPSASTWPCRMTTRPAAWPRSWPA